MRRACDRGLVLARQLGARRFEAELMTLQGHAIGELGGAADAQVLLQRASTLALEVARTYCGAVVPRRPGAAHAERGAGARAARAGRGAARGRLRQPQSPGVPPRGDGVRAAARRHPRDAPARGGASRLHRGRAARLEQPRHRARGVPRRPRRGPDARRTSPPAATRCCATSRPPTSPGSSAIFDVMVPGRTYRTYSSWRLSAISATRHLKITS